MTLCPFSKRRMIPRMSWPEVPLRIPHPLQEDLLRRLGRDPAESAAGLPHIEDRAELLVLLPRTLGISGMPEHLEAQLFAELRVEAVLAGHLERDLPLRVGDLLHHGHVLKEVDGSGGLVVASLELACRPECCLGRLENRRLHRFDEDPPVDAFLLGDLVDDVTQAPFKPGFGCCH